jgi:virulence-associated protein VapD
MTDTDDMSRLFKAIESLKKIEWFRKSVRDIRSYKVENWSDFTDLIKNE